MQKHSSWVRGKGHPKATVNNPKPQQMSFKGKGFGRALLTPQRRTRHADLTTLCTGPPFRQMEREVSVRYYSNTGGKCVDQGAQFLEKFQVPECIIAAVSQRNQPCLSQECHFVL